MLEILLYITIGVLAGSLTGIIPGIHPNTVIFTILPFYFVIQPDFISFMAFISGLSVSHTLNDFLPALFLKAPEAENALSSLPGLDMVAEGEGRKAFMLTLVGGITSVYVFILALPVIYVGLKLVYEYIESVMGFILLFFLFFIILESESRINAVIVSILSGTLGLLTLNSGFQQQFILMPIFAGLFALPAILYSLTQEIGIPGQKKNWNIGEKNVLSGCTGFGAGLLAGIVPGIGAAIATTFLTPLMDSERENFMVGLGGVNTSDILISFLALYLIGSPRSGSSVALQTISDVRLPQIMFLIGCCLFASGIAGITAMKNLDFFLKIVRKFDFRTLAFFTVSAICITVGYTTGLYGFLVFGVSSFIGTVALLKNSWAASMSVLIYPALSYFGIGFI
ncbi:MAG: tripartite tricarboxylate transporter permease [Candidatus Nanohaloarchaea archaeon]